jgi:hypothetical protein
MSFLRHGEIYRPMQKRERPANDRPRPHRYDEFPAGYSLAGCAPAEPTSASPAAVHTAAKTLGSTIKMQRTANHLLTACLTQGDNLMVPSSKLMAQGSRTPNHDVRYRSITICNLDKVQ